MCGRYRLRRWDVAEAARMGLLPKFEEFTDIKIDLFTDFKPSNRVPIVRLKKGRRVIDSAKWGFVPAWATAAPGEPSINAKGETVASKPKFRAAFRSNRCLLPADGFFEPRGPKTSRRREQFYFHQPGDAIFAMAGIFSQMGDDLTCALITTTPNKMMAPIHDRMPVILHPNDYEKWLDPLTPIDQLQMLLQPPADTVLTFDPEKPATQTQWGLFE